MDEEFETSVHELRTYFGFFKFGRTCETILCFYFYDGDTNYVKCKTGGLQGDPPEFIKFCIHTRTVILRKVLGVRSDSGIRTIMIWL